MAMDLITSPTMIGAHPTTFTRSPDSDTETPPPPPYTVAQRVLQNHHHALAPAAVVSYKECLKNHAASIGGHALDGCCEFMPGPTASASDPTSLKCAACGCHRNFHRRDPDDPAPLHHHPPARRPHSPPSASQLLLSLSGQSPSRPSDEINPTAMIFGYQHQPNNSGGGGQNGNSSHGSMSRKRFRTKFSQEQKEKMYEFSEKIGWKLRKGDEKLVEDFCKEIGVVRGVFKVWMHNNKHSSTSSTSMRRDKDQQPPSDHHDHQQQHHEQHNNININNNINNNNNNNGSCGSVVDHHQFYATNGAAQQEAQ